MESKHRIEKSKGPKLSICGFSVLQVYIIASIGVLFMKNSKSNYLKRQMGPSPEDEVLFSFK